jgi:hypothetical protein
LQTIFCKEPDDSNRSEQESVVGKGYLCVTFEFFDSVESLFLVEIRECRLFAICNPHLLFDLLGVLKRNSDAVNMPPNALAQLSIFRSHTKRLIVTCDAIWLNVNEVAYLSIPRCSPRMYDISPARSAKRVSRCINIEPTMGLKRGRGGVRIPA